MRAPCVPQLVTSAGSPDCSTCTGLRCSMAEAGTSLLCSCRCRSLHLVAAIHLISVARVPKGGGARANNQSPRLDHTHNLSLSLCVSLPRSSRLSGHGEARKASEGHITQALLKPCHPSSTELRFVSQLWWSGLETAVPAANANALAASRRPTPRSGPGQATTCVPPGGFRFSQTGRPLFRDLGGGAGRRLS